MALAQAPAQPGKHWLKDMPKVAHGSEEHANLLAAGYGMTAAEAAEIVAARKKDPNAYSLGEVRRAQAMLAALEASPVVSAQREMWKRPVGD